MVKYAWEMLQSLRITLHLNVLKALKIHALKETWSTLTQHFPNLSNQENLFILYV